MELYCELVRGALTNRGTIVPASEARVNPGERECYRSMFLHGPALKDWVAETGTVSGFKAPHTADAFVVDVDHDSDLEKARADAVLIVQMLEEIYDVPASYTRIAFSGSKGFHLIVPMQAIADGYLRPNFSQIFLGMAERMFRGFETVDYKIYEPKRIMRMSNTVNAKSGLLKIPLSFAELCTGMDEIKQLATAPRARGSVDVMPADEIQRCEGISALFEQCAAEVLAGHAHGQTHGEAPHPADWDEESTGQQLGSEVLSLMSGIESGGRNEGLVRLTGLMINKGLDETITTEIMRMWNRQNRPPLDDNELVSTVAKQYRMYAKDLEPMGAPEIITMREAGENYRRYIKRMQDARVTTGFPPIDDKLRAIAPGEVLCIVGRTSVGKSALIQNIGRNYSLSSGAPVLFFSLEMPDTSVYERNVQLEYGWAGKYVEQVFAQDDDRAQAIIDEVGVAMSNFYVVVKPMDIPRIVSYVRYAEAEIYKQKTGLILIDYLGLVKGTGKSIYEEISRIAREMKDAAKALDVPICYLSQVSKAYKIDQELEIGAARDSGAIDEAADYILGIWRAEKSLQNVEGKMRCHIGILKNRKGGLATFDAWMNKMNLMFDVEHDPEEMRALEGQF